jgi:hypothetical protein
MNWEDSTGARFDPRAHVRGEPWKDAKGRLFNQAPPVDQAGRFLPRPEVSEQVLLERIARATTTKELTDLMLDAALLDNQANHRVGLAQARRRAELRAAGETPSQAEQTGQTQDTRARMDALLSQLGTAETLDDLAAIEDLLRDEDPAIADPLRPQILKKRRQLEAFGA